ncbi:MAG: ferric reductase-like transmembrane domain-containing protein [Candidatus Dormibacteria bacterium]
MASNPSVLWYVTRGSGMVSLLLLTAVVVLGVLLSARWASPDWPLFLSQAMHRFLSLTAVVFIVLHVATAVLDPFAHLHLSDALIPFTSAYRPLWLGLGVVASELIAALVITSLVRARLGFRTWRAIHWLAYASWPIALVHGLGTGTDARIWWALLLDAGCVGAVVIAIAMRLAGGPLRWVAVRVLAGILTAAGATALGIWTVMGPMQSGWARAAGTPTGLMAGQGASSSAPASSGSGSGSRLSSLPLGLTIRLRGTGVQNSDGSGTITLVDEGTQNLQITINVPADVSSSLQLRVMQGTSSVCATSATFTGQVVSAVCGATQVNLELGSSDDGGIRGTLTTAAVTP